MLDFVILLLLSCGVLCDMCCNNCCATVVGIISFIHSENPRKNPTRHKHTRAHRHVCRNFLRFFCKQRPCDFLRGTAENLSWIAAQLLPILSHNNLEWLWFRSSFDPLCCLHSRGEFARWHHLYVLLLCVFFVEYICIFSSAPSLTVCWRNCVLSVTHILAISKRHRPWR